MGSGVTRATLDWTNRKQTNKTTAVENTEEDAEQHRLSMLKEEKDCVWMLLDWNESLHPHQSYLCG